jgi:transcriptional regulator ATRX
MNSLHIFDFLPGASLFSDYQALMRIWTHPWCLKLEAIRRSLRAPYDDSDDSLDGFVVHSDEEDEEESEPSLTSEESGNSASDDSKHGKSKQKNKTNQVFQLDSSSENESRANTSDEEVMPQPSTRRSARSQGPAKIEGIDVIEVDENGDVKPGPSGSNTRSGAIFKEDEPVVEEKEWLDMNLDVSLNFICRLLGTMIDPEEATEIQTA